MAYRGSSRSDFSTSSTDHYQKIESWTQNTVVCSYQTPIAGFWRNVSVIWSKNQMGYTITISIDQSPPCRIELKSWQFWTWKGCKTFEFDGNEMEAYWDLKSAKFSGSPEPISDYYLALVSEEETVLLLGDCEKKAYKRTKSLAPLVEAVMFHKKEHVFGKKSFSTRAKFNQNKRDHDIVVESSTSGTREPEMWISVDGIVLIHIKNLQWKFRGNQTILVNKQPVEVYWDVHAWLFCGPGSKQGLFVFKPCAQETDSDADDESKGNGSDCSGPSKYYSTQSHSNVPSQFCLILYTWKID